VLRPTAGNEGQRDDGYRRCAGAQRNRHMSIRVLSSNPISEYREGDVISIARSADDEHSSSEGQ
jgi:hypothetical protein